MKTRRILQIVTCLVMFSVALYGISFIQEEMNQIRADEELTEDAPLQNAPPIVAFTTIALGGFRGLLADILFLRSEAMKEREQYFELVQLADWIVKLQPRFTGAHAFLAWNMAYNISVTCSDHADRWRWVRRGVELLRDVAIVYNPDDPTMYKELGWIYQHKMGNVLDDAHRYYKVQLARQIGTAADGWDRIDWEQLAVAPNHPDELADRLGAEKMEALRRLLGARDQNLAQFEYAYREREGEYGEELEEDLRRLELYETLHYYLHSRWLRDEYKLEPEFIWEMTQQYGYLDFRLPEAHAVYWARQGLLRAPNQRNIDCERMVFQSLNNSFKSGRLLYISPEGMPFVGPNVEVVDAVRQAYLDAAEGHRNNRSIMSGYENFMKDAIVVMYTAGERSKAAAYLRFLADEFNNPKYRISIDDFAMRELEMDISGKSQKQVESIIANLLASGYMALAIGDDERAAISGYMVKRIEAIQNQDKKPDSRHWDRTAIQDVGNPELKRAVLAMIVLPQLPPSLQQNLLNQLNISQEDLEAAMRRGFRPPEE